MPPPKDPIKYAEFCARTSAIVRARLADPEYKAAQVARLHSTANRGKAARANKATWDIPENKERRTAWLRRPETRKLRSEARIALMAIPEERERFRQATIEAMARPEVQQKLSDNAKAMWANPVSRAKLLASCASESRRSIMRQHHQEQMSDPAKRKKWYDATVPVARRILAEKRLNPDFERRRVEALALQLKPTRIEVAVEGALKRLGLFYIAQKPYGPYILDFFLPAPLKIVIECDGTYWHRTPEQLAYDRRRDSWCESRGCRVLRLLESEIKRNVNIAVLSGLNRLGVRL